MSINPTLEIGLWNAWIFMVILYAVSIVPLMIYYEKGKKRMEAKPEGSEMSRVMKIIYAVAHMIVMPLTLILSIFLPLKLETWWFYAGFIIYFAGIVMVLLYSISFGTAPLGEPISTGIYSISRHPGYSGFFLAYLGTGIACASWLFIALALAWIVSWQFGIVEEERVLIKQYGEAYQLYMSQTPRWIGFPKKSE